MEVGSPPPMRGKVQYTSPAVFFTGITPAYAGKSHRRIACGLPCGDHPRLCGEKVCTIYCFLLRVRITPAYAGKSLLMAQMNLLTQDHPRLCGEKFVIRINSAKSKGSPPPMRGKDSKS